jgi:hypothetical protein
MAKKAREERLKREESSNEGLRPESLRPPEQQTDPSIPLRTSMQPPDLRLPEHINHETPEEVDMGAGAAGSTAQETPD